jgi:hypothetical protein
LNLVHLPDGDFEKNIPTIYLNFNLRRMACSGRSALSTSAPSDAQQDRFNQIYKTNSVMEFRDVVTEIVRLAQSALFLTGRLSLEYVDGLLCDATCAALQQWNADFGPFDMEIQGSMCDPVLLAALLSKVISMRNKLNAMGVQVSSSNSQNPYTAGSVQKIHSAIKMVLWQPSLLFKRHINWK